MCFLHLCSYRTVSMQLVRHETDENYERVLLTCLLMRTMREYFSLVYYVRFDTFWKSAYGYIIHQRESENDFMLLFVNKTFSKRTCIHVYPQLHIITLCRSTTNIIFEFTSAIFGKIFI
jgi:hypothetical protein